MATTLTPKVKVEIFGVVREAIEMTLARQREPDRNIRADEVAAMTGWKLKTVYEYKDKLGGWNCGHTLFFSRRFVEDYISKNKPQHVKQATQQ